MKGKPILLLDFDGVIHSYASGWEGANVVSDSPVEGALKFLTVAVDHFEVCIYSSRSRQWGGRRAMKRWIVREFVNAAEPYEDCPEWLRNMTAKTAFADPWEVEAEYRAKQLLRRIRFPLVKPAAFLTIDDRCICFDGTWPSMASLKAFKPWNGEAV